MKRMIVFMVILMGTLFIGCGKKDTDVDILEGVWTNESGWEMKFFAPSEGESGDVELTNWNGYDGTRLGVYDCNSESHRLNLEYPDNWNVEMMQDIYTYEIVDEDNLILYPDGETDEGIQYTRID